MRATKVNGREDEISLRRFLLPWSSCTTCLCSCYAVPSSACVALLVLLHAPLFSGQQLQRKEWVSSILSPPPQGWALVYVMVSHLPGYKQMYNFTFRWRRQDRQWLWWVSWQHCSRIFYDKKWEPYIVQRGCWCHIIVLSGMHLVRRKLMNQTTVFMMNKRMFLMIFLSTVWK